MPVELLSPVTLPCGAIIAHRLAKPAITEGLADPAGWPTEALERLYSAWADSGFALMITGNIIVDADHIERPGNIIIDRPPGPEQRAKLKAWTTLARRHGAHLWAQLSHSGRQTQKSVNPHPLSASAIAVGLPGGLFGKPRAMTETDILAVIDRFGTAAAVCKAVGFTGVQVHAAHGYLISSFLSPSANQRSDQWGGSLANRARLLLQIVAAIRKGRRPGISHQRQAQLRRFPARRFRRGREREGRRHAGGGRRRPAGNLGGQLRKPAMVGEMGGGKGTTAPKRASTLAREAYFLEFARTLRRELKMPIMLTGGLRTRDGMQQALDEGVDILGVARPICVDPVDAAQFLIGATDGLPSWEEKLRHDRGLLSNNSPLALVRTINSFAGIYWFYDQLYRLGRGEAAKLTAKPLLSMASVMLVERGIESKRKKLRAAPSPSSPEAILAARRSRQRSIAEA